MDNAQKAIMIGVGLFITIIIISAVLFRITLFMLSHFLKSISKSFRFGPQFIEI